MKKKELSKDELAERDLFVEHLEKAGWSEAGPANETYEARMSFNNGKIHLVLEYSAEIQGFYFYLINQDSGKEVKLVIQYEDEEKKLLELITSFQKKISPENFRDYSAKIAETFPQTFVDIPGKGLYQLSEDEEPTKEDKPKKKKS